MIIPFLKKTDDYFKFVELRTENLILRPPSNIDGQNWLNLRNESRDFLEPFEPSWVKRPLAKKDYESFLNKRRRQWLNDTGYSFLVFHQNDNSLVGNININNVVRGVAQFASVGYWIGEKYASKGYMTESLEAVIRYALTDLKLNKITAACLPENAASRRVLTKLNFSRDGYSKKYLKIAGKWQDHVLYSILYEDL